MEINNILKRIAGLDVLSAEEKEVLSKFDLNKHINDIVAAEKRKMGVKLDEAVKAAETIRTEYEAAKAKIAEMENGSKSTKDQLSETIKSIQKELEDTKKAIASERAEKAKIERNMKLDGLLKKAGISFVPAIDQEAMSNVYRSYFDGIDNLDDQDVVAPVLQQFVAKNKAAIVDKSGGGSGVRGDGVAPGASSKWTRERIKNLTPDEYKANQKEIMAAMTSGNIK